MYISCPEKILRMLKENEIFIEGRAFAICKYGHKYDVKKESYTFKCPICKKYTNEHIKDIIEKRKTSPLALRSN